MGCAAEQQQQSRQGQGHQETQPAAAAVGEQRGGPRQQGCRRSDQPVTQPPPAQRGNARQRHQGQEVARQQVGIAQRSVNANRAGTHRVGIGPAGELFGGGIQLPQRQDTAQQTPSQQGGQQSVPPDDLPFQQRAHQGEHPQITGQLQQALGGRDRHGREPCAEQSDGEVKQHPAADGSDPFSRGNQCPEQPKQAGGGDFQPQPTAGHEGQAGQQQHQHHPREQLQPLPHGRRRRQASPPAQEQ